MRVTDNFAFFVRGVRRAACKMPRAGEHDTAPLAAASATRDGDSDGSGSDTPSSSGSSSSSGADGVAPATAADLEDLAKFRARDAPGCCFRPLRQRAILRVLRELPPDRLELLGIVRGAGDEVSGACQLDIDSSEAVVEWFHGSEASVEWFDGHHDLLPKLMAWAAVVAAARGAAVLVFDTHDGKQRRVLLRKASFVDKDSRHPGRAIQDGRHARLERALTPARAPAPAADTEPDELGRSLSEMEDMMARLNSRPSLRGPSAAPSLEMDS